MLGGKTPVNGGNIIFSSIDISFQEIMNKETISVTAQDLSSYKMKIGRMWKVIANMYVFPLYSD